MVYGCRGQCFGGGTGTHGEDGHGWSNAALFIWLHGCAIIDNTSVTREGGGAVAPPKNENRKSACSNHSVARSSAKKDHDHIEPRCGHCGITGTQHRVENQNARDQSSVGKVMEMEPREDASKVSPSAASEMIVAAPLPQGQKMAALLLPDKVQVRVGPDSIDLIWRRS